MNIFGAGIAGLLAGCHFQKAEIFEKNPRHVQTHKALLRFRDSAVGDSVGIPFNKVKVRKGIWYNGEFVQPNIQLANWYAQKVIGNLADRSIWNLDPVDRFIAPEDFIEELVDRCGNRIRWNDSVDTTCLNGSEPIISTIPMPNMLEILGKEPEEVADFNYQAIHVDRYRIPGANVHQTIYYPDPAYDIYRASITGDLVIVESVRGFGTGVDKNLWCPSFGIDFNDPEPIESSGQRFGKIAPIEEEARRGAIFEMTQKHNIYSLGRFATWRNILLDDVLNDINVLKRLMKSSAYENFKISSK